ncbi:cell division protein FtsX [Isoptericola sp. CG 20/1183]|uniref:Cell division protein FtsX n=1 Tax=Isoptericola halotolerans TaxID=300560 RepID=A0ABX5EF97_9MICO|nr:MULTISPECIES: permease-like cell division protein FtsX [Isoptericola]MCK0117374.1 permease-like cell division protein FtsX [Isoptericola sp. S6320L]PRZ07673.1 cell division protein FtsX [Isoptericola halotolerans]PRZ07968.1 cell division protein FtsX [Isoptericola sp. CG 20/1183]
MRLQFILVEVLQGLRRNATMVISVILVTFVSLTFVGSAALLQAQVTKLKGDWYDLVEVSVFLCPDGSTVPTCAEGEATEDQIATIEQAIETELDEVVATTYFESKAEAFEAFEARYPDGYQGTQLTEDDMQASYRLQLADPEQYQVVDDVLSGRDGVEVVEDQRAAFEPLFLALNRASLVAVGLAAVMLLAAALLITTTIRLSAVSRRRETGIMRLVGASNLFVQLPFMLEGAIAALVGAVLAVGGLWLAVQYLVVDWLAQSVDWVDYVSTADVLAIAPLLLGVAVALALVSSVVTLHRYTRV